MALLLTGPLRTSWPSSSSSSTSALAATGNPFPRLHRTSADLPPRSLSGLQIHMPFILKRRDILIVKASSNVDDVLDGGDGLSESDEEIVPVENLPLESKLQLKLEQKMKMKLAKKVRLRRKKLLRKRRMRKNGRWPPSKMKKSKNV